MKPTKSESGSPNADTRHSPILSQRQWRKAGALTIAACALLAWIGASHGFFLHSLPLAVLYWAALLGAMAVTFIIVWLDLRYIRLQYAIEKRNVFRQTLGDHKFREQLIKSQENPQNPRDPQ